MNICEHESKFFYCDVNQPHDVLIGEVKSCRRILQAHAVDISDGYDLPGPAVVYPVYHAVQLVHPSLDILQGTASPDQVTLDGRIPHRLRSVDRDMHDGVRIILL